MMIHFLPSYNKFLYSCENFSLGALNPEFPKAFIGISDKTREKNKKKLTFRRLDIITAVRTTQL